MRSWKVLDFGKVPRDARKIEYTCMGCMNDALLPIVGVPLAQIDSGVIFDIGAYALPKKIQCPHCRKRMEVA